MKKLTNFLKLKFLILSFLLIPFISYSQGLSIEENIVVPSSCSVTDSSGRIHNYPKSNSPQGLLGVCALVSAKSAGIINSFEFIDFGFGLFLNSINGISTSPDWDLYWALYLNDNYAMVGLSDLVVKAGDKISLIYSSFSTGQQFDRVILHVVSEEKKQSSAGVAYGSFNVDKAVSFILSKQNQNGSFENDIFTDWIAIALSSYQKFSSLENKEKLDNSIERLKDYLILNTNPGESLGSPVLSFIRRAMALMSLGINPYFGTNINYIEAIVNSFDGEQIGDKNLINDDIFGLLVLKKAGYDISEDIIQKTIIFILSKQKDNGSWENSVDMTAAAIQSLSLFSDDDNVKNALKKARDYLFSKQEVNGSFGNQDSTSWAMQAISALNEDWRNWRKNNNTPADYLMIYQKEDGRIDSANALWSTAYAVPAGIGKHWGIILKDFSKKEAENYFNNKKIKEEHMKKIKNSLNTIYLKAISLKYSIGSFSKNNQSDNNQFNDAAFDNNNEKNALNSQENKNHLNTNILSAQITGNNGFISLKSGLVLTLFLVIVSFLLFYFFKRFI